MATASAEAIRPNSAPQERFLSSSADIAVYGGAAGAGKTFALLLECIRHTGNSDFGAVVFRRTYPQITNEGGLWDESEKWYPMLGADPKQGDLKWDFPSGARVRFAHLQYEKDKLSWKGAQIPLICFDQLEDFSESQFFYLLSRNRSTCGIAPYVRGTCNPDPDSFLATFLAWWIDQETGYPIPERSGAVRWFVRVNEVLHWADSAAELEERFPASRPLSVTFVPGKLEDNTHLEQSNPEYRAFLMSLPLVERERLLGGNWKIRPAAGRVFPRSAFGDPLDDGDLPHKRKGMELIRAWDKAATGEDEGGDPDWTVGVLLGRRSDGAFDGDYVVLDVQRFRLAPGPRDNRIREVAKTDGTDVRIMGEQEPGAAGKSDAKAFERLLEGFNVHTEPSSGSKEVRANPAASAVQNGHVKILRGPWNESFLEELNRFPTGGHDDQVDAFSMAYNRLALGGRRLDPDAFQPIKK